MKRLLHKRRNNIANGAKKKSPWKIQGLFFYIGLISLKILLNIIKAAPGAGGNPRAGKKQAYYKAAYYPPGAIIGYIPKNGKAYYWY